MQESLATTIVVDFEQGRLTRRQLVSRLMGLGAALAALKGTAGAQPADDAGAGDAARATFQATGLDHIALDVTDVARSREFYQRHLGLRVIRGTGNDSTFMGADRDFFLALFRSDAPSMNHYCYAIENYEPGEAVERLTAAGLQPRRTGNRVYFPDPDGLTVQVTGR